LTQNVKEIPVIWLAASACTGCSVSLLNAASPRVKNLLVDQVIPGAHVNLTFHQTIMAGSGEVAITALEKSAKEHRGKYLLAVDGAIPTGDMASCCAMGEEGGKAVTMEERFTDLARNALAVMAVGTCASFGGVAATAPNPSNAQPLDKIMKAKKIDRPLINVPGCPPHPDWIMGTISHIILNGLPGPEDLDTNLRPLAFYGKLIHENCPRRAYFDEGRFAKQFGDEGCLYELGCKGPITYADCPIRHWNNGTSWKIDSGAPCQGCTQPEFFTVPCYQKLLDVELPKIGAYWLEEREV